MDESLGLAVCRPEFDRRSTAEDAWTAPLVPQYDTAYSCAPLWLKCPKPSRVGIGTQIFRLAGLGLPFRMACTADGDDCKKRDDDGRDFRRLL